VSDTPVNLRHGQDSKPVLTEKRGEEFSRFLNLAEDEIASDLSWPGRDDPCEDRPELRIIGQEKRRLREHPGRGCSPLPTLIDHVYEVDINLPEQFFLAFADREPLSRDLTPFPTEPGKEFDHREPCLLLPAPGSEAVQTVEPEAEWRVYHRPSRVLLF
jgi:hypothetical protein